MHNLLLFYFVYVLKDKILNIDTTAYFLYHKFSKPLFTEDSSIQKIENAKEKKPQYCYQEFDFQGQSIQGQSAKSSYKTTSSVLKDTAAITTALTLQTRK